jgi:uncharacterized protein YlaN (UPF0358 family)
MTRNVIISIVFLFFSVISISAKPIDKTTAERLSELRRIKDEHIKNGTLSEADISYLFFCIDTENSILSSVSFWLIGEQTKDVDILHQKLLSLKQDRHEMSLAFLKIALEKLECKSRNVPWNPSPEIRKTENPYLKLEIARELMLIDKEESRKLLENLSREDSPLVETTAHFYLMRIQQPQKKRNFPDYWSGFTRVMSVVLDD